MTRLRLLEWEEQTRLIEREIMNRKISKGIQDIQQGSYIEINSDRDLETFFANMRDQRLQNPGEG